MSIPPLVCSTPPPPDQCEDEKDPEDFDLSYSLSQEDDDDDDEHNGYSYGNFSSYNNFQSAPDNKPLEIKEPEIAKNIESEVQKEIFSKLEAVKEPAQNNVSHNVLGTNDINENKLKCEEEMNIEDLDLKFDEEIESIVELNSEQVDSSEPNVSSVKDSDIPCNSNNDSPSCDITIVSSLEENAIDSNDVSKELNADLVEPEEPMEVILKVEPHAEFVDITVLQDNSDSTNEKDEPLILDEPLINSEFTLELSSKNAEIPMEENVMDEDDFGDFDDFQSVNTKTNPDKVDEIADPWQNADSNESDFGNFTAHFEDNQFRSAEDVKSVKSVSLSDKLNQLVIETNEDNNLDDDDDFGDFDDFQSNTESKGFAEEESLQCQDLPVLNLQSAESDHQIMESINKVLSCVFLEEISEPENEFEGKLETLLSETWGHLMETDERQPYIVNWNNSLGQKTLLRALCIDSRNILFGPKWSSNMPKYAANLSNAPLQPQKHASVSSSVVPPAEIVAEKSTVKPTTWTDPFTSDGQESCNTENESSTIRPRPTDLDVFESSISTKPDKIYSNTMGVQPLRQINLPDTHIFTPTDSEIPRSKTIHYDAGPPVLLPQPMPDKIDNAIAPPTDNTERNIDDNDYWEFQNFKSSPETSSLPGNISSSTYIPPVASQEKKFETATTVNALPVMNIAYQTELLQPIKVEPAMPTLNWPDPGEVKAFDDFSNFVSMPTQTTETQETASLPRTDSFTDFKFDHMKGPSESTETVTEVAKSIDDFDDDFDTFQSALPSKSNTDSFKGDHLGNEISTTQITGFDYGSPKFDSFKSDTISFASIPRPNEALTQKTSYVSNATELNSSPSSTTKMPANLLQPTPASFSAINTQSQQKSAQILQPLSLESYSQINWPSPGIDLQDLSRFNPVETLHSLKSDLSVSGLNKTASPVHAAKNAGSNQVSDDDGWGEFVSSKPKQQQPPQPKKPSVFVDDDEWTDFISSPSVKPQNGLNTISLNVHTNSNIQKSVQNKFAKKSNQPPLDIPTLNYITPKSNPHKQYKDKHFQNL